MIRRGRNISKIETVIDQLANQTPLDPHYKDHALTENLEGNRDCHIEPDWLLIYKIEGEKLHLVDTGSHSDLF